MQVETMEV